MPKVGDGTPDAALFIAEEAFIAGFLAAVEAAGGTPSDWLHSANEAWANYEPSEMAKDLS